MKTRRVNIEEILHGTWLVLIGLVGACLLLNACVREDVNGCVQYSLSVKVVDSEGNDITSSGTVTAIDLYLFDSDGFVRLIPRGTFSDYSFGEDEDKDVTLVAWGNLTADSLQLPELAVGTSLEEARVALLKRLDGSDSPSSDLFYSKLELTPTTRGMNESTSTIVLQRLASRVSIRTLSLEKYFGTSTDSCRIVVRGAGNSLNFLAKIAGEESGYEPVLRQDAEGNLYAAPFCVFPTQGDGGLTIELYREGKKLFSTFTDQDGELLQAPAGKTLNVSLDFSHAGVKVTVNVTKWDEIYQETEM